MQKWFKWCILLLSWLFPVILDTEPYSEQVDVNLLGKRYSAPHSSTIHLVVATQQH